MWQGLERESPEHQQLRSERCQVFWDVLEQRIPDIRQRCDVVMEGTPLTHRRFSMCTTAATGQPYQPMRASSPA